MQKTAITRRAGGATARVALCRRRAACVIRASANEWTGRQFTLLVTSREATGELARAVAGANIKRGDAVCLKGDEKAGKSLFAQEFIRAVCDDADKAIGAPATGTLQACTYETSSGAEVRHFDLRGAPAPSDGERKGLAEAFESGVSLVECAERLQEWGAAPEQRLAVWIRKLRGTDDNADVRLITIVPHTGAWDVRAGLLHANVSRTGAPAGLVVLSDDMAASLIKGLPESLLAVKA